MWNLYLLCFQCSKASFKDSFPLLYKAAEELDAAVGEGLLSDNDLAILEKGLSSTMTEEEIKRCKKGLETTLLMKREFNELVQSKRAFAKLSSSGFCVTLSGPAEAAGVLCTEGDTRKGDSCQRKVKPTTKVTETRTRMRKTLEGRHTEILTTTTTQSCTINIQQAKIHISDEVKPPPPPPVPKPPPQPQPQPQPQTQPPEESTTMMPATDMDVDEIVQMIEGTHLKIDPNPKKAAKKARQKEKKEMERQRIQEEKEREEEQRRQEELRRIKEEKRKEEQERKKREVEEQRRKDEILRKQKELAEQKKEELRKKRQELEQKKVDEKKLKKEAKKQRRELRKKELEDNGGGKRRSSSATESHSKTDYNDKGDDQAQSVDTISEKEYGRLKHEKEQRKREEEEARRLEQLQAQERSQANKKNKKKKKKPKQSESQNANDMNNMQSIDNAEGKAAPVGQPLIEILSSAKNTESSGKNPEEKNNLVTIKKHMDSSVTISMKGKEGENDLVYTLMNGQGNFIF